MIRSIAHKGLEKFFLTGSKAGIRAVDTPRLRLVLATLDVAENLTDIEAPGLHLHSLKGDLAGYWAVTVRANWRLIFKFDGGNVHLLDYLDYH